MKFDFPLLLDGATGTELQKRGFTGSESAESWVLANPDEIISIQRRYIDAGSDVIYAPTFGANRIKLADHGIIDKTKQYNLDLVGLSKKAAENRAMIAGDISPCGKFVYPLGELSFEELIDIYTEQAAALEEAGVDLFVIETMLSIQDARAAVLAVKAVSRKPVFVTFSCDKNGKTLTGTDVCASLITLQEMGIDAFGLNCGAGPEQQLSILKKLQKYAKIPLISKANAGTPTVESGKTVYRCDPAEFTAYISDMADCGAAIFGGCCGTDRTHIAKLHEKLENISPATPAGIGSSFCSTERAVFDFDPGFRPKNVISCGPDLEDDLDDALESGDEAICLEIKEDSDIDDLIEVVSSITKPVCFLCADAALLEKALRIFQGRAMYCGGIDKGELSMLTEKYGLIIL